MQRSQPDASTLRVTPYGQRRSAHSRRAASQRSPESMAFSSGEGGAGAPTGADALVCTGSSSFCTHSAVHSSLLEKRLPLPLQPP